MEETKENGLCQEMQLASLEEYHLADEEIQCVYEPENQPVEVGENPVVFLEIYLAEVQGIFLVEGREASYEVKLYFKNK